MWTIIDSHYLFTWVKHPSCACATESYLLGVLRMNAHGDAQPLDKKLNIVHKAHEGDVTYDLEPIFIITDLLKDGNIEKVIDVINKFA